MNTKQVSDVEVTAQTFEGAVDKLYLWTQDGKHRYVSTCTVYTLMKALENESVYHALKQADMVTADGMPLVWLQHLQGQRSAERVYGPDLMLALCERTATDENVSHFLFGGLPGVVNKLADDLHSKFPHLKIVDMYSPPLEDVGLTPNMELVEMLNASKATVLWVGLGSPKQDLWMALYRPVLNIPLLIGVGAAFDFISHTKRQAPLWMQRSGLEWLFRLFQEPGRLWRRYLVYNSRFMIRVFKEQFLRINSSKHRSQQ